MTDFLDVVRVIQNVFWILSSILVLIALPAIFYKPKRAHYPAKNVEIIIVSIASNKVRKALYETIRNVEEFTRRYNLSFKILIDEGAELENELRSKFMENLIIVPKNYRRDLIGKGRALNYFVENYVRDNYWYTFLDDDNIILSPDFLYEIAYYEEKKEYAATNPILVPRMGKSSITYIMDFIRFFDDLFFFRFFTGLVGKPLIGLHGELLTVRGSVLREIGFCRRSLTEDFQFAIELVKRGYKTWHSRTRVSIRSPNSIKDLLFQRGRWFKGVFLEIFHAPLHMKLITIIRMIMWILGLLGTFALGLILGVSYFPLLTLPAGIYYSSAYLYGFFRYVFERRREVWNKEIFRTIVILFSIPFLGIIENISWIFGLKIKNFIVLDKN
ncbi:MAG: glycosyltransferase family 2 protein [Sulfolobaceae archaeon]